MTLNTHPYLATKLGMSGAIPVPPICVSNGTLQGELVSNTQQYSVVTSGDYNVSVFLVILLPDYTESRIRRVFTKCVVNVLTNTFSTSSILL